MVQTIVSAFGLQIYRSCFLFSQSLSHLTDFIHNALDELITCGETEIAAANMRIVIGRLGRTLPSRDITGFHQQYEVVTGDIIMGSLFLKAI